ncbi:MAG: hypothetical protein L0I76_37190 [Pseudonocardia sp.]|nr:hypothetical protein [Pseudonocardia sp.]
MPTFSEALRTLTSLPGAQYSCITERHSGTVLAEHGPRSAGAAAVLDWARLVAGSWAGNGALEDIMITGMRHHHLVRQIRTGDRAPLLAHLCLDRSSANLAQARLALSGIRPDDRVPVPEQAQQPGPHPIPGRAPAPVRQDPAAAGLPTRSPGTRVGHPAVALAPVSRPAPRGMVPAVAEALPDAAVPMPRRPETDHPSPAVADPGDRDPAPSPIPAGGWATDLDTMRRLLDGLRRIDDR